MTPREAGSVEVLKQHPDVVDTALVTIDTNGEPATIAVVSVGEYCSPPMLREYVYQALNGGSVVDGVVVLDDPSATPGDVDPAEVSRRVSEGDGGSMFAPPRGELESRLTQTWARLLELPRVGATDDFLELGGDSLKAAALLTTLADEYGAELDVLELMDASSVRGLASMLLEKGYAPD